MRIACLDIGGTYIKHGVFENNQLFDVGEVPTNAQKGKEVVLEMIRNLVKNMGTIDAIGVSCAGEINSTTGTIVLCDNIKGFTGLNLKQALQDAFSVPVSIENDVNAAALGESVFGNGKYENFLMITYGTGVGGAVIQNNEVYHGTSFSAGEFGGIVTHADEVRLDDRGSGSYERYASVTALVKKACALDARYSDGRIIFEHMNESAVRQLVDSWICEIAVGIVSLIHVLNPECVVLGGGIMREPYIVEKLQEFVTIMKKPSFGCEICQAKLHNTAGMMGVASLAQGVL